VRHLDVFARSPGGGNPCPVVLAADGLRDDEMLAIAAHFGEETAFVRRGDGGRLRLRYFVPRHEMSMCVHATIAAITVLVDTGGITGGSESVNLFETSGA
jgi:trans-2,3-dihydro-3-hydroxyanthranilate isomerase